MSEADTLIVAQQLWHLWDRSQGPELQGGPPWMIHVCLEEDMEGIPLTVAFGCRGQEFRAVLASVSGDRVPKTEEPPTEAFYWVTPLPSVFDPDEQADKGAVERERDALRTFEEEHGDQSRLPGDDK